MKKGHKEAVECPLPGSGVSVYTSQIFCFMLQINWPAFKGWPGLDELRLTSLSAFETHLWENNQIKAQWRQIKPVEQLTELTDVSAVVSSEGRDNITVFTSIMQPTGGVQQQTDFSSCSMFQFSKHKYKCGCVIATIVPIYKNQRLENIKKKMAP